MFSERAAGPAYAQLEGSKLATAQVICLLLHTGTGVALLHTLSGLRLQGRDMKESVQHWCDPLPNPARQRCPAGVGVATTQDLSHLSTCHGHVDPPPFHFMPFAYLLCGSFHRVLRWATK